MFLTPEYLTSLKGELLRSLTGFAPELVLCAGLVLLLLLRLVRGLDRLHLGGVALGFTIAALWLAWTQWQSDPDLQSANVVRELWGGMLAYDTLTVYLRLFLLSTAALTIILCLLTGIPDTQDSADFFCLLLGATLGMSLMASANHLLMVYIAVEMASLPSYGLAGFLKGRRPSSEAALKYVVYGGAASGVMLYGISLLAGRFGTGYLPEVATSFASLIQESTAQGQGAFDPILITGMLLILIGVAFKLAAVPFHFWCPDVFEGAAAEVAAFLSVASKAAAIALLGRFSLAMTGGLPGNRLPPELWSSVAGYLGPAIAFFAALTATFGNLAAYAQTNLKRLLAYSTIAHAGYMMMALAPLTREGLDAALFYLISYLFMNLGAFAVVAFLRNRIGSEDLRDYGGLISRYPLLTVSLAIFFLSLVGLPPLVGFMAKFQVFSALYHGAESQGNVSLYALLVIGLVNSVISLVYYIRVLKVMIMDPAPAGAANSGSNPIPATQALYAGLMALVVTIGIFAWDPLAKGSAKGVMQFQSQERPRAAAPAVAARKT